MPKVTRAMPSFEGVAGGQTATLRMPIGYTYHQLLITYAGATLAQVTGVRLIANGKAIHTYKTFTQLDSFNQFEGRAAASGIIVLDLDRYGLEGRAARELTAIGTGHPKDPTPLTTLSLELDIDAAATSPALSAKAIMSGPAPLGFVKKVRQFSYYANGAGVYEIASLPKGDLINQVYFTSANIDGVELQRDNYVEFKRTDGENDLVQGNWIRSPQSGLFVYDPTEHGNGSETLATKNANDLRFNVDMSAAGNIGVTVVYLGPVIG